MARRPRASRAFQTRAHYHRCGAFFLLGLTRTYLVISLPVGLSGEPVNWYWWPIWLTGYLVAYPVIWLSGRLYGYLVAYLVCSLPAPSLGLSRARRPPSAQRHIASKFALGLLSGRELLLHRRLSAAKRCRQEGPPGRCGGLQPESRPHAVESGGDRFLVDPRQRAAGDAPRRSNTGTPVFDAFARRDDS